MPYFFKRMDFLEVPVNWLYFQQSQERSNLLCFPWLFPPSSVVTYFRAINYSSMFSAFSSSVTISTMVMRMSQVIGPAQRQLLDKLTKAMTSFLVLEIRRDNILADALNQLWRRQKRELNRPLKIRMGMDEGEEGVDLGGVQQEFFRLALRDALDPAYGLFTIDEATKAAWFAPCSRSPLYQYVLIGLLVGLALFNGLTLTVTFPLALYRKLLDIKVNRIQDISDGWPGLSKGLKELLEWADGDVEDIFLRSYVFSVENAGKTYHVDMRKHADNEPWPSEDQPFGHFDVENSNAILETADMVSSDNRDAFVKDYIHWLTDKSIRPQYEAFATGFFLPLNKRSLRLFTPESLKALLEGIQEVDVNGLERTARYENGFGPHHPRVRDFWTVVRSFSPEELRRLLEFVTASDRIPVRGIEDVIFIIQRNGSGDEVSLRFPAVQEGVVLTAGSGFRLA